jgi:nucleoid DNA-binding protein
VTKKEIVKSISDELGLTQLRTKEIVQKTFDAIVETLVEERRIELRNFGVFEVKMRAARKARNPRTGGQVEVPAKFVVTFKPGKEMEAKVRELEEREEARKRAASGGPPFSARFYGPEKSTDWQQRRFWSLVAWLVVRLKSALSNRNGSWFLSDCLARDAKFRSPQFRSHLISKMQ